MSSLVTLFSDDCVLPSTANVKFAQASRAPCGNKKNETLTNGSTNSNRILNKRLLRTILYGRNEQDLTNQCSLLQRCVREIVRVRDSDKNQSVSIPKIVLIYGGHMSNAQEVYRLLNAELDRRKFGLVIIRLIFDILAWVCDKTRSCETCAQCFEQNIGNRYYFSLNVKFRIIISSVENQSQRLSPLNLQLSLAFDLNQPKSASRMLRANEDMLEEYYNHGLFLECIQKDLACSLDDIYQSADENIETVEDEIQSINVKLFLWAAFFDHYNLSLHFWRRLNVKQRASMPCKRNHTIFLECQHSH
ncbi:unnamed protein product [Rotaria magnacalcarata]|uniref:Uncharacterized protein n=1 Tax=Rotaria magnacalcarata TaxID=392030 RepID=A0A815YDM6_9BILA|nr:unnamed protein product [Rotaria magnacalcarata]